jgi:hypothetical protein
LVTAGVDYAVGTEFGWLRMGPRADFKEHGNEPSGYIKAGELLTIPQ